jgi:anti-anti-sigma factor
MSEQPTFTAEVDFDRDRRVCVIGLVGKLDPAAVEPFERQVDGLYADGVRHFVIDFTRLDYTGSLGLRVFVSLSNRLGASGGTLGICNLSPEIQQLFEMTKLTRVFRIYPSRADAIDAASR